MQRFSFLVVSVALFIASVFSSGCSKNGVTMNASLPPSEPAICKELRNLSEDGIIRRLKKGVDHATMQTLFLECDLENMGDHVHPEEYFDLIKTKPISIDWSSYAANGVVTIKGEYWEVIWAIGFDPQKAYEMLPRPLKSDCLEMLIDVRKQFPKMEGSMNLVQDGSPANPIVGWTTFGSDKKKDALVETTPNRVFLVSPDGKILPRGGPALMMKYINPPWYLGDDINGFGFVDYFRFITRDVVIARGLVGPYSSADGKHPIRAVPLPFQQFGMRRIQINEQVNLSTDTQFFLTSIIRSLWNEAKAGPITEADLNGEWDVDVIMNKVELPNNGREYGRLLVSSPGGSFKLPAKDKGRNVLKIGIDQDKLTTVMETEGGNPPLKVRKISPNGDVLVGKVCFDAISKQEVIDKVPGECHDFLPYKIKAAFMSQYFEPFGGPKKQFCNYFLLRKKDK